MAGCCNKPSHCGDGGGDEEEKKDDAENELSLIRQTNVLANTVGIYLFCL